LASGYSFELLVIDGKDAGYMVYAPYDEPGTVKLHKLYLLEEYQGKGYGQKMLQHVIEAAELRGFTSVILAVNKQNLKAQKAYARFGFEQYKSVQIDIGNGFIMDDYWLRYDI
jgi:ribosomal protein S18 acetylase RimI-like enzyme